MSCVHRVTARMLPRECIAPMHVVLPEILHVCMRFLRGKAAFHGMLTRYTIGQVSVFDADKWMVLVCVCVCVCVALTCLYMARL